MSRSTRRCRVCVWVASHSSARGKLIVCSQLNFMGAFHTYGRDLMRDLCELFHGNKNCPGRIIRMRSLSPGNVHVFSHREIRFVSAFLSLISCEHGAMGTGALCESVWGLAVAEEPAGEWRTSANPPPMGANMFRNR